MVCARLVVILSEVEGISIAGFAHDISQAVPIIKAAQPDVVLIGSHFPRGNATRLLQFVKREYPRTVVMMLSDQPGEWLKLYTEAGANFGFDKATQLDALVTTLKRMTATFNAL